MQSAEALSDPYIFSCIFYKTDNFCDFLFAFLAGARIAPVS